MESLSSFWILYRSTHLPLIKIGLFSYQDIINASWSLWKQIGNCFSMRMCVTWDICGRRLISLRLTACGSRLLSNWQSSTPSLRAWARSQTWHHTHKVRRRSPEWKAVCPQVCGRLTCAFSHVTRWLSGRTRHSINHAAHCRHNSIFVF